jgi:hypothetical protein
MDKLRADAAKNVLQASTDGRFLMALEEASNEAAEAGDDLEALRIEAQHSLMQALLFAKQMSVVDDDDIDSFRARVRSKLEESVKDGRLKAFSGSRQLYAPAHEARRGDEVLCAGKPQMRGTVLQRTTTDILMLMDDGSEAWHEAENVEQVLFDALDVKEGDEVITALQGQHGKAKKRTTTEILVLNDNGTEEWYAVENVGIAKSRFQDTGTPDSDLFEKLDINQDGMISREEFMKAVTLGLVKDCRPTAKSSKPQQDVLDKK